MSIKISHEIPKQLFPHHSFINDYPYILGHLLSQAKYPLYYDSEYANFYYDLLRDKKPEFSILDNSGYELGESIPNELLYELGELYQPSHIVLPDVAFRREETLERTFEYIKAYGKKSKPKFIACIQGQGLKDFHEVYDIYEKEKSIDIIAVSMCIIPRGNTNLFERVKYIDDLIWERGHLTKPLHILGCKHPNEFLHYKPTAKVFIHSIDTSAPIVYGWNGVEFGDKGISLDIKKPTEKLADNLDKQLKPHEVEIIANNVKTMRSYIN